uniref:F-BAR and double SH3 domains protein 2-like n=1 Tax=Sinocyclocheilus rhinocerous TaxID=307959 RepID=A0A673G395_9TELE
IPVSPCQRLHSSLPPLPLYDQPPCSPYTSPETSSAPSLPRSPSVNGEHKLLSPESPGFSQPLRLTPDGSGSGKLRPVRAAPPPPKQHARRQVEKTEEVEITLV